LRRAALFLLGMFGGRNLNVRRSKYNLTVLLSTVKFVQIDGVRNLVSDCSLAH